MKKITKVIFALFFSLLYLKSTAQVTVTRADKLDFCLNAAYTSMADIVIDENANNDFTAGSAKLMFITAPTGFEFNPAAGVVVQAQGGADITNGGPTAPSVLLMTSNVIIIQYEVTAVAADDRLTIKNIAIKSTALGSGNLTIGAGSSSIVGIVQGTTSLGNLSTALTSITAPSVTSPVCSNSAIQTLSGTRAPAVGTETYTSSPTAGAIVGGNKFYPSIANGSQTITYSVVTAGCTFTKQTTVDVNAAPNVTLVVTESSGNNSNDFNICSGGSVQFEGFGANSYAFYNRITSINVSNSNPYTNTTMINGYYYSVVGTATNGCVDTATTVPFTVNSNPAAPTWSPTGTSYFVDAPQFKLDTLKNIPVPFSTASYFTGSGVINSGSDDLFYANVAGVNPSHTLTYHYVDGNGCSNSVTANFEVKDTVNTNWTGVNSQYCWYDPIDTIRFTGALFLGFEYYNPKTLTWVSMTDVLDGVNKYYTLLDPQNLILDANGGSGPRKIRASYLKLKSFSFVTVYSEVSFVLNAQPEISINIENKSACSSWGDSVLAAVPSNGGTGVFSSTKTNGTGTTADDLVYYDGLSGEYKIRYSAPGLSSTNDVTYTFTNSSSGCIASKTTNVYITNVPAAPTVVAAPDFCSGDKVLNLQASVNSSTSLGLFTFYNYVEWYKKSDLVNYVKRETAPTTAGAQSFYSPGVMTVNDTFYVRQYRNSSCVSAFSSPIIVNLRPKATVDAGTYTPICEGGSVNLIATKGGASTASQTWSLLAPSDGTYGGTGASALNPSYQPGNTDIANGYANLIITTADPDGANGCPEAADTVKITINKNVTVVAGSDYKVCSGTNVSINAIAMLGVSQVGGTWTGGANPSGFSPSNTSPTATYTPSASELTDGAVLTFIYTSVDPDGAGPCDVIKDTQVVEIKPTLGIDANSGNDIVVCSGQAINLSGTVNLGSNPYIGVVNWITYNAGGTINSPSSLNTTYTPTASELNSGANLTFYLKADDPDGAADPCLSDSSKLNVRINPLPKVSIYNLDTVYCRYQGSNYIVLGDPAMNGLPETKFTVDGVDMGSLLIPYNYTEGAHTIRYTYKDGLTGCVSFKDSVSNFYSAPDIKFSVTNYCATKPTSFADLTTINGAISTIATYKWDFGDPTSIGDTSNLGTIDYTYPYNSSEFFTYIPRLIVTTNKGCTAFKDSVITIGKIPPTNFRVARVCPDDNTTFTDLSGFADVSLYTWNFGDPNSGVNNSEAIQNPVHQFIGNSIARQGQYNVTFTITSNKQCDSTITKMVSILPKDTPTVQAPYYKTFDLSHEDYSTDGTNTSWAWGTSKGTDITTGTRNIWITDTSSAGKYNIGEKSNLNLPCFNFENLSKPMAALKIWCATQNNIAGAILESSVDNGTSWQKVGDLGEGQNWYDGIAIAGAPGSTVTNNNFTNVGWQGQYGTWKIAKIGLSNLAGQSNVRFRVNFGAPSDSNIARTSGFAIDSIWVGNRSKVVLLEHFTSNVNATAKVTDAYSKVETIRSARPQDMAVIHYHTAFPSSDDFNLFSPEEPSARVLYYGVAGIPRSVLDGNAYNGDIYAVPGTEEQILNVKDIDRRSLDFALFDLSMNTNMTAGKVDVSVKATYNGSTTFMEDVLMQIVVVEDTATDTKSAGTYNNVMRKMLPNAGGAYFNPTLNANDTLYTFQTWNHTLPNNAKLGVVAFLQNVTTKEIYQASYIKGSGSVGNQTVDVNESSESTFEWMIYPNPSDEESVVLFNESLKNTLSWTLLDATGKEVLQGQSSLGSQGFVLNTADLKQGVYILKLNTTNGIVQQRRIVVSH